MERRDFLRTSVAASCVALGGTGCSADRPVADSGAKRGLVINLFESKVMKGSPPLADDIVTLRTAEVSHEHRVWAQQHMQELCPTQPIRRAAGSPVELPRSPTNVDEIKVRDLEDNQLTVGQLIEKTNTNAFIVLHRGKVLTEQYFSGMRPDVPHFLYSLTKSVAVGVVFNLLARGDLDEHGPIERYVPELKDSAYAGATVRHRLDM